MTRCGRLLGELGRRPFGEDDRWARGNPCGSGVLVDDGHHVGDGHGVGLKHLSP